MWWPTDTGARVQCIFANRSDHRHSVKTATGTCNYITARFSQITQGENGVRQMSLCSEPAQPCGRSQNATASTSSALNMRVTIMLSDLSKATEMPTQPTLPVNIAYREGTTPLTGVTGAVGRSFNKNIQTYSYFYELSFTIMTMVLSENRSTDIVHGKIRLSDLNDQALDY